MKALFVLLMLFGSYASANTAFDTLRRAFDDAPSAATIHDFEGGIWENCVFSDVATPQLTQRTQVRTLQYMTGPGQGPLFPGDNDHRIDVFNDFSLDNNLVSFFQSSIIEADGNDFRQVLDGPPWRRMNIYGRTDTNMLLFFVEVSDFYGYQAPMYPRVYGYCWHNEPSGVEQPLPVPAPQ